MPGNRIEALDKNLRLRAILGNAMTASYTRKLNDVWTASFDLPYDDPKNAYCQPMEGYIRIIDEGEAIGPFRIMTSNATKTNTGEITYGCLHVLSTLMDDIMPGYHQIGNIGIFTRAVLEYVLSFQLTKRWRLGRCAFARQFEYSLEDEGLLAALFSIPKPISTPYRWTMDTTAYPWTINLDVLDTAAAPQCYIRYGKNQLGITKNVDLTNFCTRLYCYGFGEGINRLGIDKVNGGVPYLQSPKAITDRYGIWQRVFIDRRFEIDTSLKERGEALLAGLQEPYVQYQVQAVDMYPETRNELDRFKEGKTARVVDDEFGEDVRTFITDVTKRDVLGNPSLVDITLQNKAQDIAGSIAEIADVQRIEQLYSQGATNIYSVSISDNADPTHPLVMKIWIPDTLVNINRIQLVYTLERFRAYDTGTEYGGASVRSSREGGGSVQTSSDSGRSTQTSSKGGGDFRSTDGGGGDYKSTDGGGSGTASATNIKTDDGTRTGTAEYTIPYANAMTLTGINDEVNYVNGQITGTTNSHAHSIPSNTFISGDHRHRLNLPAHTHAMDHSHTIRNLTVSLSTHSHGFTIPVHSHTFRIEDHTHSIDIPAHTHKVDIPEHTHVIDIPSHAHSMAYGIYEGPVASTVRIEIGGVTVPVNADAREVDIAAYMEKNSSGQIVRGRYHTVNLYPNTLTRISATATPQVFIQSRGGADY